jgi:hypothetical protein
MSPDLNRMTMGPSEQQAYANGYAECKKELEAMPKIEEILTERKKTHGEFCDHARVTWGLKRVMEGEPQWGALSDIQREALAIIAHKIGRIMSGNPNHHDHWDDIAGYARLVSNRLPVVSRSETTVQELPDRGVEFGAEKTPPAAGTLYAELALVWNVPWAEARRRAQVIAKVGADAEENAVLSQLQLQFKWRVDRTEAIKMLKNSRRPDPVEDSNRHAFTGEVPRPPRMQALLDGLPVADYIAAGVDYLPIPDAGRTGIVDRFRANPEVWAHLPRLPLEQNHKEWSELPYEYRHMYAWNGEKYMLGPGYVQCWGRQP